MKNQNNTAKAVQGKETVIKSGKTTILTATRNEWPSPEPAQPQSEAPAVSLPPAAETRTPAPEPTPATAPTLADVLAQVAHRYRQAQYLEKLEENRKKLAAFDFSGDGTRDSFKLTDSHGHQFETSNPALLADVLAVCKATVARKIQEITDSLVNP